MSENESMEFTAEIVEVKLTASSVKRIYSQSGGQLDTRDVIIAVREKSPSPWNPVSLDFDGAVSATELAKTNIFLSDSEDVKRVTGVGTVYFVLQEGEDLEKQADQYQQEHGVVISTVLLGFNSPQELQKLWDDTRNTGWAALLQFPASFASSLRKLPDGLDVAEYARDIAAAKRRNSLTDAEVLNALKKIYQEVDSGKVKLQSLEDTRSMFSIWLTLCATIKKNLTPLYLDSYVAEYLDSHFIYPVTRLSFFERYRFTRTIPQLVGYVGVNNGVKVTLNIANRVAPNPVAVYDMASQTLLPEDLLEEFTLSMQEGDGGVLPLDYRTLFKQSSSFWTGSAKIPTVGAGGGTSQALAADANTDASVDHLLKQMFVSMIQKCAFPIFPSIRNTAMIQKGGKNYIAYFPEEFGLVAQFSSEIFGVGVQVIKERDFHRLINAPIVLACNLRDGVSDASMDTEYRENKASQALAMPQLLRPALDPEVLTAVELAGAQCNQLSYYDYHLRCDERLFPVVFYDDLGDKTAGLFDHLDVRRVTADVWAMQNITSFGGLCAGQDGTAKLHVSYQSFRGCRLLE